MELFELSSESHRIAKEHGFWDEKRNIGELLMLIVSELGEALEADRKNHHAYTGWIDQYPDDTKDSQFFKINFETSVKNSFEDEIADTYIRLGDLCGGLEIDIEKHIKLKMKYNEMRGYKHGKNY